MTDYYKILNISFEASDAEIKKQFRKLAKRYHPDKNGSSKISEDIFKDILNAYETLKNKEKREIYDIKYRQYNLSSKYEDRNDNYNFREKNGKHTSQNNKEENNKKVFINTNYVFWIFFILLVLYFTFNNNRTTSVKYIKADPTIEGQNTEIRPQSGELDFNK